MTGKTYEDGITDGLKRAVEIAGQTGKGKIVSNAIMKEITTRQMIEDLTPKAGIIARQQAGEEAIRKYQNNLERSFSYQAGLFDMANNRIYRTKKKPSFWARFFQVLKKIPRITT